jgi:hypothetical protein
MIIGGEMKKRLSAFVLFVMLSSGFAYGDGGWNPGCKGQDSWLSKISTVCSDLWNYVF